MKYSYKLLSEELIILKKQIKESNLDINDKHLKNLMKRCIDLDKALKLIDSTMPTYSDKQVGNYNHLT
jgi:hypothetical protein